MLKRSRIAAVIDATLLGMFLSVIVDLPMPGPLVAALSVTSVVLIFVGLDSLSAYQRRRIQRTRSQTSVEESAAAAHWAVSAVAASIPATAQDMKNSRSTVI